MTRFSRFPWILFFVIAVFYGCEQLASDYNPDPGQSDIIGEVQVQLDEPGCISSAIYDPEWRVEPITRQ